MSFFSDERAKQLPQHILALLNRSAGEMGLSGTASPRTVGDRTQEYIAEKLLELLPAELVDEYTAEFSRRAMADLAFKDRGGNYYVVDVKTHCRSTQFNMPNLISVERLTRFYEDPSNFFCILMVGYEATSNGWSFTDCTFEPVENFDWSCLTIGALGWGQLQIANANIIRIERNTRRKWMLALFDALAHFYPREIEKVEARMAYFEAARQRWLQR